MLIFFKYNQNISQNYTFPKFSKGFSKSNQDVLKIFPEHFEFKDYFRVIL